MTLGLTHVMHDRIIGTWNGKPLFEYVYVARETPFNGRRPYFHPLYTLNGELTTIYRPYDHPWHKGLSMTFTVINDQNFWGGVTYQDGTYVALDNVGQTEHQAWTKMTCQEDRIDLAHTLTWRTAAGADWLSESRAIAIHVAEQGWYLDWDMRYTNISGISLEFGSPATQGRQNAGYTGLFWRGPRSYDHGDVLSSNGDKGSSDQFMGKSAMWLAYTGRHDGSGAAATLIFCDQPDSVRYPTQWFVRDTPYACVASAFVFDQPLTLEPQATLRLKHRVVIADGALTHDDIGAIVHK
jgi:hypothetical protein